MHRRRSEERLHRRARPAAGGVPHQEAPLLRLLRDRAGDRAEGVRRRHADPLRRADRRLRPLHRGRRSSERLPGAGRDRRRRRVFAARPRRGPGGDRVPAVGGARHHRRVDRGDGGVGRGCGGGRAGRSGAADHGDVNLLQALAVLAAGFAAGGINAIVGSGSLVTFPVLLAVGYSSVTANVSNSVGLVFGNISAAWGYREELEGQRQRAMIGGAGTAVGAITGGVLLLTLPEGVVDAFVPILILLACVLMVLRPKPKLSHAALSHHRKFALIGIGFAVGVYGGYFGAAQGVILLAALRFLIPDNLQRLNGLKNVMVGVANGLPAILFTIVAHVAWDAAALVAVGSIAAAQLGARYGRRIPEGTLRWTVVTVGVIVAIVLIVK